MIDNARLEELVSEIGDGAEEILLLFLEEAETVIDRLAATRDGQQRTDQLHFLRSGALNLGFTGLAEISARAEACEDAAREWPGIVSDLQRALVASREALRVAAA